MKFFIKYHNFYDCSGLLYALSRGNIEPITRGEFVINYNDDEYYFSNTLKKIPEINLYIVSIQQIQQAAQAIQILQESDISNYKLVQMQLIENFHGDDQHILDFLNKGNIILSSATVNFSHPNFVHDPFFNLFYLYYYCGYNYINFHKNDRKLNLLGTYYRQFHLDGNKRPHRTYLYNKAYELLGNDLKVYTSLPNTSFSNLLEHSDGFGFWMQTYISTYTDYTTSVCNIMFETQPAVDHSDPSVGLMYNRVYITEKTLQSLLYSKENIFFIWYGPIAMLKMLKDMGFWFLNFEFFDENYPVTGMDNIAISSVENSCTLAFEYLKNLKEQLKDNDLVYKHLLEKYGGKLENNGKLFDSIITSSRQKEKIVELIRK